MTDELYIWVVRWGDFQHYAPERDRPPAWIKTYPKQLDDDRYTDLPPRCRALLHDLRLAFARTSGRLPVGGRAGTSSLSRRTLSQVFRVDLERLRDAGFIEFVSREALEQNLEPIYNRSRASRARPRAREEGEVEVEGPPQTPPLTRGGNGQPITKRELRRFTGCRHTRGTHGIGFKRDPLGTDKPPPDWPHDKPTADEVRDALAEQAKIEAGRF